MSSEGDYFKGMSEEEIKDYKEAEKRIEEEEKEQHNNDQATLETVKKQVPLRFFEQIEDAIEESENCRNFRIVDNPEGQLQGNISDEFKEWVDQYCGECGDDYHGTVWVELPNGKYLAWDYWM